MHDDLDSSKTEEEMDFASPLANTEEGNVFFNNFFLFEIVCGEMRCV